MIALAYLIITVMLMIRAAEARPVVPRWLYWTYAGFIFCRGLSHVVDDVTDWFPVYPLQTVVLSATTFMSLLAALLPITIWIGSRRNECGGDKRYETVSMNQGPDAVLFRADHIIGSHECPLKALGIR